ncbi:MAG TPA: ABC transporter permease, partial [Candidatus Krumholzibacterium sp.]|nr:ABC transporter permease [Candidatus Krumholzibacterium sp.]
MIKSLFLVALRSISKQKGLTFIKISGLSLGMACCILILLWVRDEMSYEDFHEKSGRIARVVSDINFASGEVLRSSCSMPPIAKALEEDYPEVEDAVRFYALGRRPIKIGDEIFYEDRIVFADPGVFDIFT